MKRSLQEIVEHLIQLYTLRETTDNEDTKQAVTEKIELVLDELGQALKENRP